MQTSGLSSVGLGNIEALPVCALELATTTQICTELLHFSPPCQLPPTEMLHTVFCEGLMKSGLLFLWIYVLGPTNEFPLRSLLLPFLFCFLLAACLPTAKGFFFFMGGSDRTILWLHENK